MSSGSKTISQNIQLIVYLVVIIWLVEIANFLTGHSFYTLGILPRQISGLKGIILFSFVHGSLQHALFNTIPLFALGAFSLMNGKKEFIRITIIIILAGGSLLWIFGRGSYHVGASLLIFGYFGYILANAWHNRTAVSILIALVTIALYGGLIYGILPTRSYISWEGHLFGLIAGVLAAGRKK